MTISVDCSRCSCTARSRLFTSALPPLVMQFRSSSSGSITVKSITEARLVDEVLTQSVRLT